MVTCTCKLSKPTSGKGRYALDDTTMLGLFEAAVVAMLATQMCTVSVMAVPSSVKTNCAHGQDKVRIEYFGAAKAVFAVNKKGMKCFFKENPSTATFEIVVQFHMRLGTGVSSCFMDQKEDMKIFSITVKTRMDHPKFEGVNDEAFLIQCNFEPSSKDVGGEAAIADAVKQPVFVSQNVASPSKSTFKISFLRVDKTAFPGPIAMGRKMQLKVEMTAVQGDVGFKVSMCKAISSDGKTTRMLLADGCGVGLPWGNKAGITTKGMTGFSPYFTMFRVKRNQNVVFSCDFIVCKTKCDGSSCEKSGRKKRDTGYLANETLSSSTSLEEGYIDPVGVKENDRKAEIKGRQYIKTAEVKNDDIEQTDDHLVAITPQAVIKETKLHPMVINNLISIHAKRSRGTKALPEPVVKKSAKWPKSVDTEKQIVRSKIEIRVPSSRIDMKEIGNKIPTEILDLSAQEWKSDEPSNFLYSVVKEDNQVILYIVIAILALSFFVYVIFGIKYTFGRLKHGDNVTVKEY